MKRTAKRCEFYAPRYNDKTGRWHNPGRWHNRSIYVDKNGKEFVKLFGEFVSVETMQNTPEIVKEFRYV